MSSWKLGFVPVLMYHSIAEIPNDRLSIFSNMFERQLHYLQKNNMKTLSLESYFTQIQQQGRISRNSVVITFDDGYLDNYTNALPLLLKYDMKASVFPVTKWIGRTNGWEDYPGKTIRQTMDWVHLKEWVNAGMEVGVHTVTHRSLSTLSSVAEIREELNESRKEIREHLNIEPKVVCYPYGDFDERVQEIVRQEKFSGALAILDKTPFIQTDAYAVRRTAISQHHTMRQFYIKVSPIQPLITIMQRSERIARRFFKTLTVS